MDWPAVVALGLRYPGVEVGTSYGTPALKLRRVLLTRYRPDDDSLVILDVSADEREMLIAADPGTFFCEDHYRGYDIVLARLAALDAKTLGSFLERRWRARATKAAVAAWERGQGEAK